MSSVTNGTGSEEVVRASEITRSSPEEMRDTLMRCIVTGLRIRPLFMHHGRPTSVRKTIRLWEAPQLKHPSHPGLIFLLRGVRR